MADGKVIIATDLDNDGIEKGVKEISGCFGGLKNTADTTGKAIKAAFNSAQKEIASAQKQIQNAESAKMPLVDQARELGGKLDEAKAKLAELQNQQAAANAAINAPMDRQLTSQEIGAYMDAQAQKPGLDAAVAEQQKVVDSLQQKWDRVNDKIDSYDAKIDSANYTIDAQTANVEELSAKMNKMQAEASGQASTWSKAFAAMKKSANGFGNTVSKAMNVAKKITSGFSKVVGAIKNSFSGAGKSASGFGSRLKSIVSGAFVFNLISAALRKVTDYLGNAISSSEEMKGAMANLKGAAANAAAPIISVLTPALVALANAAATVFSYLTKLISFFTGKTATASKQIQSAAGSAKKAMKSLAGFDEITKLDDNDSGGGGGGGANDFNYDFEGKSALLDSIMESVKEGNWSNVGALLSEKLNSCLDSINWPSFQKKASSWISSLVECINGFVRNLDWGSVGSTIGESLNTLITSVGTFFANMDWTSLGSGIGEGITSIFTSINWEQYKQTLTEGFNGILELISGFASGFAPLQGIDFTAATESLRGLWQAVMDFVELVGGALAEVYKTVLKPILKWAIEDAAPASVDILTAAFDALSAILEPVMEGLSGLMNELDPVIAFIEDTAIVILDGLKGTFEELAQVFTEKGDKIQNIISGIGKIIVAVWKVVEPVFEFWKKKVAVTFEYIGNIISTNIGAVIDILSGVIEFIAGVFTGDWERAWNGIVGIFDGIVGGIKGAINSVIGYINGLISGAVTGINTVIRALNRLSFTIPSWVPVYGGRYFGFSIGTISAPSIPYLAQGAVLPANKPFLAMVGDQRHGTNVEAPLTTIQEAVALVMEDQTAAILAGFEASVGVQREILEAVLGIQIGDDVIGNAVSRYTHKQAIMRGGAL